MKWKQAAIITVDPANQDIAELATAWKRRYAVPKERCFAIQPSPGFALEGFTPLTPGCLWFSDLSTKIIIAGHGRPEGMAIGASLDLPDRGVRGAGVLSDLLKTWGLRAAGLLAFKSCLLGKERFLDDMKLMCTVRGIRVGWLIGYRHVAHAWWGREHQLMSGDRDVQLNRETYGRQKMPDSYRVKIVKGNCFALPTEGRSPRYAVLETQV